VVGNPGVNDRSPSMVRAIVKSLPPTHFRSQPKYPAVTCLRKWMKTQAECLAIDGPCHITLLDRCDHTLFAHPCFATTTTI
jgi:hypothetical protein